MEYIRSDLFRFKPNYEAILPISGSRAFWLSKRFFDLVVSILLLPCLIAFCIVALVLNPFFNKGPLFYIQTRMGKNCRPFKAIKFRTMSVVTKIVRGHDDPIEVDRITLLGGFFRRTRIDEVPQIINVLLGDMSLIGPRPDYYEHAKKFLAIVPGYRARYHVRPGISGLAQVSLGYAEGIEETRKKTHADHYYISNVNFKMDTKIALQTVITMATQAGV